MGDNIHFNKRYNTYDLTGEYGIGYTSKGEEFYFDLEDYERIKEYCWCVSKTTDTIVARIPKTHKNIVLHQLIMNTYGKGKNVQVDHIYHNRHDNRKSKLRICSNAKNNRNKGRQSNNSSGYPGVSWDKRDKVWHAYIETNGERINHNFHSLEEAIKWRKEKEEELFKEYRYKGIEHE